MDVSFILHVTNYMCSFFFIEIMRIKMYGSNLGCLLDFEWNMLNYSIYSIVI